MISSPSTSSDITPVDIISTTVTNHKIVLTGHCELAACPFGTERTVCCMASLEAPHFEEKNQERKGIDLVCVVDKSGSMAGPKLDMVISTLTFMVDQFKDKDRVAIIAFDTDVHMSLGLTKMDNEGKKKAKEVSSSISPGSCTNISDAILASLRLLAERKEKNEVTSVILFTDGLANRGLIKTSEILQSMQDVMDEILPTSNITVHTFGFGKDTDANMLTSIAQQGNGLFDFMETVDDVPKAFGNVIGNLVSVVGQNIKIKIQPKPNVCVKQIMTGYRIADLPNGAGSEVTVGDVYSGEKKDVVFILSIPKLHNPLNVQELAEVSLSYFNVIETESESIGFDLTIQRNDVLIESQSSLKLDLQRNRVLVSDAMKQAKELSDSHKLVEGRQVLTNCIAKVQQSISGKDKFCQALIQDMTRILLSMQDVQSYQYMGNRLLNNGYQQNLQQRATSNNIMNAQASFLTMPQMFYASTFHHNVNIPSNPPNLNTLLPSLGSIFPKNNANEK